MRTPPNMDQVRLTVANDDIAKLEKLLRVTDLVADMRLGRLEALEKQTEALIDNIVEYGELEALANQGMSVNMYQAKRNLLDAIEQAKELLASVD